MLNEQLDPDARLDAHYTRIGVRDQFIDGSGARSIVEAIPDQINAYDTAVAQRAAGFAGCWVFQLGTNDTANVSAGSTVELSKRIDRMMSVAGSDPVLWMDVTSRVDHGDYSSDNMRLWNDALADARQRYPNLRVFAWSSVARDEWFQTDGVHYTTAGYTTMARSLTDAVVTAFPA
jgi:lysophospholipase L1-like esterase